MKFPLNYKSTEKGIPFLCQHGLASNLNQPQSLLEDLKKVQLISADCPGHGATPIIKNKAPSFNNYANNLLELLRNLNIKKAIFGGISMGSGISLNIALRFPKKVKALVLIRPAWLDKGSPQNLSILLDAAKFIGLKNGQMAFEQNKEFKQIQKKLPKAAASILGVFANTQRPEIPLVLEKMIKDYPFSDLEKLKKIDKPCLIIGANDDFLHPFEMAEKIHQMLPQSQLEKITSNYVNPLKHKEEINQLVSKFISNL